MAIRVPTYRERQVQQQAVPNVRQQIDTPAAAFGSLQADALVNSGTAAVRLGEQWNRKAINMDDHKPYVEGEKKLEAAGYKPPEKPREKNPLLAPRQGIKEPQP